MTLWSPVKNARNECPPLRPVPLLLWLKKLQQVLEQLAIPAPLPLKHKDHKLKGDWIDFRECHIESDWLLIYTISDFELRPVRVGTHSELFD